MAKTIIYTCDYLVSGKPCGAEAMRQRGAQHTLTGKAPGYSLDSDLCESHLEKTMGLLAKAGVQVSGWSHGQRKTGKRAKSGAVFTQAQVREWAQKQGYEVKDKGPIAKATIEAYAKAH